jgi:hypothetical protein
MMEESKNLQPGEQPADKPTTNLRLVGINMAVLAGYTILCALLRDGGLIFDAFIIAGHFFICVIMAAVQRRWVWVLSAFMVLIIGFSTCVGVGSLYGGGIG